MHVSRGGLGLRIANALRISDVDASRMFSSRPPPFALSDHTVLVQVRNVQRGEVCFLSSGVLAQCAGVYQNGVYDMHNFVRLPEAMTSEAGAGNLFNISGLEADEDGASLHALELDVALIRHDGAVHVLVRGANAESIGRGQAEVDRGQEEDRRGASFIAVGARIDFVAQEAHHAELRMGCHVHLEAEDRDGSPWTNCFLDLRGVIASQEFDPMVSWDLTDFRSDDDAANALAVLPWTSW